MTIKMYNVDCMEYMRTVPDKYFDLAIVDPPYGIDAGNTQFGRKNKSSKGVALKPCFEKKDWDKSIPEKEYFESLFRVSKNQIIWGANYMTIHLPPSMGWIVWDKNNGTSSFSDCELAFSSFDRALRKFTYTWSGILQGDMKSKEEKIHPTQKPVKLYQWLLRDYAKQECKILDTHLGSGSSAIAAHYFGAAEFVGTELDADYFKVCTERFEKATAQQTLF